MVIKRSLCRHCGMRVYGEKYVAGSTSGCPIGGLMWAHDKRIVFCKNVGKGEYDGLTAYPVDDGIAVVRNER